MNENIYKPFHTLNSIFLFNIKNIFYLDFRRKFKRYCICCFYTRAHLFLPDEGSFYIVSIWNNCCMFLDLMKLVYNAPLLDWKLALEPSFSANSDTLLTLANEVDFDKRIVYSAEYEFSRTLALCDRSLLLITHAWMLFIFLLVTMSIRKISIRGVLTEKYQGLNLILP